MGFGSIISGSIPFVGDLIQGAMEQKEANKNRNQQDQMNAANYAAQKEFAQYGIRWKVEDAKAAGLHPLAALGASGAGFSPSYQMSEPDHSMSNMVRNMGQDYSRAIAATSTAEERMMRRLQMERMALENKLLSIDVDRATKQVGPGFPADGNSQIGGLGIKGQGDSSLPVQIMPMGRTASPEGKPHQAYGSTTEYSFTKFPDGSLKLNSSPDIQGDKANDVLSMLQFHINRIANLYGNPKSVAPSYQDHPLPPDMEWEFRASTGRFHPVKKSLKRPWYRTLLYR